MFAREQYFDSAGLYITVVYSGPILLNCFIMTVSIFIDSCPQKTVTAIRRPFIFAAERNAWYNYWTICLLLVQNLDFSLIGQETKST